MYMLSMWTRYGRTCMHSCHLYSDIVDRSGCHMETIWVSVTYHLFISAICFPHGSKIDEKHALFWLFPICSAKFYCQHVIYMRTVFIVRYMLCIWSACGQDRGKHVCIPATLFRHCRLIWQPYGKLHECLVYIIHLYMLYAFHMAQQ